MTTDESLIDSKLKHFAELANKEKELMDPYPLAEKPIPIPMLVPTLASSALRKCYDSFHKHKMYFWPNANTNSANDVSLGTVISDYITDLVNASNEEIEEYFRTKSSDSSKHLVLYNTISNYLYHKSMDDIVQDAIIEYCRNTYAENQVAGNVNSIGEMLSPFKSSLADLGMDDIIPIIEKKLSSNVLSEESSPYFTSSETASSPENLNLRWYERTTEAIINLYKDETMVFRHFQAFNDLTTAFSELAGRKEKPISFPDGHYISLVANHKLNDIFKVAKDRNFLLFAKSDGKNRILGSAIAYYFLNNVSEYYSLLDYCFKALIRYANSNALLDLRVLHIRQFLNTYLGIPIVSRGAFMNINSKLQIYEDKYTALKNADLPNIISDSVVDFLQQNDNLKQSTPILLRNSIIPDLQELGMDGAIPILQEKILAKFGNDLTPSQRFAVRYPIMNVKPSSNSQSSIPYRFNLGDVEYIK